MIIIHFVLILMFLGQKPYKMANLLSHAPCGSQVTNAYFKATPSSPWVQPPTLTFVFFSCIHSLSIISLSLSLSLSPQLSVYCQLLLIRAFSSLHYSRLKYHAKNTFLNSSASTKNGGQCLIRHHINHLVFPSLCCDGRRSVHIL